MSLLDVPFSTTPPRRWFGVGDILKCTGPTASAKGLYTVIEDGVLDEEMGMYSYVCAAFDPGRYVSTKGRRIYSCFLEPTVIYGDGVFDE
jgi:hypothetical protein